MKTTPILSSLILVVCGVSFGQDAAPRGNETVPASQQSTQTAASPAQGQNGATPRIAPGSVIPVQLTKTIDAKKAKTGDQVEAKVTQDLKTNNGDIIVAKDTKVLGHVTEAQGRSKDQKESQVGIAFDHAVMRNGGDVPLPMSIQAVISPDAASGGNGSAGYGSSGPAASAPSSGGVAPNTGSRVGTGAGSMPSEAPRSTSQVPPPSSEGTANNPPITGKTEGVVGISNLKLSAASQNGQGSLLSSDKSNVKLESGTLMLLRVNQ
jgi:hypothetical protein